MKLTESKIIEVDFFEDLVKWSAEQGFAQAHIFRYDDACLVADSVLFAMVSEVEEKQTDTIIKHYTVYIPFDKRNISDELSRIIVWEKGHIPFDSMIFYDGAITTTECKQRGEFLKEYIKKHFKLRNPRLSVSNIYKMDKFKKDIANFKGNFKKH